MLTPFFRKTRLYRVHDDVFHVLLFIFILTKEVVMERSLPETPGVPMSPPHASSYALERPNEVDNPNLAVNAEQEVNVIRQETVGENGHRLLKRLEA